MFTLENLNSHSTLIVGSSTNDLGVVLAFNVSNTIMQDIMDILSCKSITS